MSRYGPTPERPLNLSADIVWMPGGWEAELCSHPWGGGPGEVVWKKTGMRTMDNAAAAMDAAWNRLQKEAQTHEEQAE